MKHLSAYRIFWAIAIPIKGKATKRDYKRFSKQGFSQMSNVFVRHSGKIGTLNEKIAALRSLHKDYELFVITDKQLGMVKNFNFKEVATTMQKRSAIILQGTR